MLFSGCKALQISCADGILCYDGDQWCDDKIDCPDASDELGCLGNGGLHKRDENKARIFFGLIMYIIS